MAVKKCLFKEPMQIRSVFEKTQNGNHHGHTKNVKFLLQK